MTGDRPQGDVEDRAGGAARPPAEPLDFIRQIVTDDLARGKNAGRVATRFPPEPNGYLHIGHAKSICLNFGVARDFGGSCNLRFDDTNPAKEEVEYVESIMKDVRWLGFDWQDRLHYASDYFEKLYEYACDLIREGKAYVDSLTPEEIREHRGTLTEAGRESPYRNRTPEENLDLFRRMRAGEFADGEHVLPARIDMASPNINLRDPTLYRIRRAPTTGPATPGASTRCTTTRTASRMPPRDHALHLHPEFEDHRPLYDWVLDRLDVPGHPQQIEFARLNLTYTVLSKRKLLTLVRDSHVSGWDDPRMPTLRGMRRRGYTPEAIRAFCERIGVAKRDSMVEIALLEHAVREDLNRRSPRAMAVLRPLKLVIENYPEGQVEEFEVPRNPEDQTAGMRSLPFSRVLFIEQEDFREEPPPKYFRLSPGREVRLRGAYLVRCTGLVKDPASGEVLEVRATYDPATRGGDAPDGRKVKSTIHWVSAGHALEGRGAALRAAVHGREPGRRRLAGAPEPGLARGAHRMPGRAEPGERARGEPLPVRAAGLLLLGRVGLAAGRSGLEPHRLPEGRLGEDRIQAELGIGCTRSASASRRAPRGTCTWAAPAPRSSTGSSRAVTGAPSS
jgi:glutaminyl-tRNA synthetase